jgi:hypothetical protein
VRETTVRETVKGDWVAHLQQLLHQLVDGGAVLAHQRHGARVRLRHALLHREVHLGRQRRRPAQERERD